MKEGVSDGRDYHIRCDLYGNSGFVWNSIFVKQAVSSGLLGGSLYCPGRKGR